MKLKQVLKSIASPFILILTLVSGYHIAFEIRRELGGEITLLDWIFYILTIPFMILATALAIILWLPPSIYLWYVKIKKLKERIFA